MVIDSVEESTSRSGNKVVLGWRCWFSGKDSLKVTFAQRVEEERDELCNLS